MNIDAFVINILFLEQSLDTNIKAFVIEDFLGLSQTVTCNMSSQGVNHTLTLRQVAIVQKSLGLVVQNSLTLNHQSHPHGLTVTVTDFLFIWHETIVNPTGQVRPQSLALSHAVIVQSAKGIYSALVLSQAVNVKLTKNIAVNDTLGLKHGVASYKPSVTFYSFPITIGGGIDG